MRRYYSDSWLLQRKEIYSYVRESAFVYTTNPFTLIILSAAGVFCSNGSIEKKGKKMERLEGADSKDVRCLLSLHSIH